MKRRRVKITGIGPVTPAGIGRQAFWKGILEPVSRVRPYSKLGEELGPFVAATVGPFDIEDFVERNVVPKGAARQTLFAIAGASLAIRDAGLTTDALRNANCVVVTGSSLMDFGGIGGTIESVGKRGMRGAQPRVLYAMGVSSVASAVNDSLNLSARTMAISTQCAAGMDAVGYAADLIAFGEADIVVCGGTEAPLHRFPLAEMRAAELTPATKEMPERIARPFDLWRTTGVVSEGACMFVLEAEESSRRGYSYVEGYAFANDNGDGLCSGMAAAGRLALAQARIRPNDVEAIFAWGPGHRQIDRGEALAMANLFESSLAGIPAVSIKGAIGTTLGAAPAIQIAAAALGQSTDVLPPTVNWNHPDPECPFNLSREVRYVRHEWDLLNAHGVGGVNASIVLRRC